jgi:hypothetical protein
MFKPGVWDTNLLFTNAEYWSKNATRPNFGQLPNTVNLSPEFAKLVKDARWAVERDGSAHGHAIYGTGPDYFYGPSTSGLRSALMGAYKPTVTQKNEADPYSWQHFVKSVAIDGTEVYRKSVPRAQYEDYKTVYPLARVVASPPQIDPVTKKATNRFFTLNEIKGNCFQTYRFINILLTSELYMIIATQQTVLNEAILVDQTLPVLKRLNSLNMVVYKGSIETGTMERWTI